MEATNKRMIYLEGTNSINSTFFKDAYSVLILLLPVLMIFKIPFLNIGLSTLLVLILLPYVLLCKKNIIKKNDVKYIAIVSIVFVYLMIRSVDNLERFILFGGSALHVIGFLFGTISIKKTRIFLERFCLFLTFLIIFQSICFYLFGIKFTYLIKDLIIDNKQYVVENFYSVNTSFRPSAIFLEPAHFSQFVCVGLLSLLFPSDGKTKWGKVILVSTGVLLSTSGIGLLLMAALFFTRVLLFPKRLKQKIILALAMGIVIVVAILILKNFSFFNFAIDRIFGEYTNGNAIWGRTVKYGEYISTMRGVSLFVGNGGNSRPDNVFMTGYMELVYCFGYFGVLLYFLSFILLTFRSRSLFSVVLCLMYFGLLFAADVIGFMNILFFSSLIICNKQGVQK